MVPKATMLPRPTYSTHLQDRFKLQREDQGWCTTSDRFVTVDGLPLTRYKRRLAWAA